MSTKKRIASTLLRVALAAGVLSAGAFGLVRPLPALTLGMPAHQRSAVPHAAASPIVVGARRALAAAPQGPDSAPTTADFSACGDSLVRVLPIALFVAWITSFARKASRTRGQPLSNA